MGRATRWFRGFLGMKKDRETAAAADNLAPASDDKREKKRWSFSKSKSQPPYADVPPIVPARHSGAGDGPWFGSSVVGAEKEKEKQKQSRHANAMAVATATAAAADAAVAAAEAAVAVARLTAGQGRCALSCHGREAIAAVKIQSVFRGFLARKALRALRGLVKLQALIRGYLVRKRAATALYRMQSLIRAQTTVRSQRARRSIDKENQCPLENRPRKSTDSYDESRSEFHSKRIPISFDLSINDSPKVVEVDSVKSRSRSRRISNSPLSESRFRIPHSSPVPRPAEWCMVGNDYECRFSGTIRNSPGLPSPARPKTPVSPVVRAAGGAGDGLLFHPYNSGPSYMANTKSFRAKVRSQSAPKQRPEDGSKKRLSLSEIMASRHSISGVRMERSFNRLEEIFE